MTTGGMMASQNRLIHILLIAVLFLFISASLVSAAGPNLRFEAGNRAYLDGDYRQALNHYLSIDSSGYEGGALYFNIGNSYYKLGEIGEAILYWEKAARFYGDDDDLQANLAIARRNLSDKLDEPVRLPIWNLIDRFRAIVGVYYLVVAASVLMFLIFLAIGLRRWVFPNHRFRRLAAISAWTFAALLIIDTAFIVIEAHTQRTNVEGVFLNREVEILSAPAEGTGRLLFTLHEGSKVRILRSVRGWYEISAGRDKQGWVRRETIGII